MDKAETETGFFDFLLKEGSKVLNRFLDIEFKEDELAIQKKFGLIPQTFGPPAPPQPSFSQPGFSTQQLLLLGGAAIGLVLLLRN